MKRVIVLAFVLVLGLGLVAFATGPTPFDTVDVDMDWSNASGSIGVTVVGGDDGTASFRTVGAGLDGTFTADYQAGGYGYMEVNTLVSRIDATVANGGFVQYNTARTDCYGGWCPAGQTSNSFVGTGTFDYSDPNNPIFSYGPGTVSMGTGSKSHLNGLIDYNYPSNGTLSANADNYTIMRNMAVGGSRAALEAVGSGSATLQNRNSAIDYQFAPSGVELGGYSGCPPTASFHAQGTGTFYADGTGVNVVEFYDVTQTGNIVGSGGTWVGALTPVGPGLTATSVGAGAAIHQWTSWNGVYDYSYNAMRAD